MGLLPFFIVFYTFISFFSEISIAADTITLNQSINDTQTIISTNQRFELGFFTPGNSKNRFLGIWYKNIPGTVVWVANRDNPVTDSSGILTFGVDRNLLLLNQTKGVIWSSNSSRVADNPVAQLLDSGNFVLKEESKNDNSDFLWQSFDHPSDTLLPRMKLGWNLKTRFDRNMTSWRNADDPSQGDFSFGLYPPEAPQLVLRSRTDIQFRVGPWDGSRFSGSGELKANPVFNPIVISNSDEVYYKFEINDESTISRFVINYLGAVEYLTWNNQSLEWASRIPLQKDGCDTYGKCGAHGACVLSSDSAVCECLKGFKPKSPQEWESVDWSSGCDRKSQLDCGNGDGFVKFNGLKLPDKSHFWVNKSRNPGECKAECLNNCSCMAYTEIDINCVVWFNDLMDIRKVANHDQVLYIRMARAELEAIADSKKKKRIVVAMVAISAVVGSLLLGWMSWYFIWKRRTNKKGHKLEDPEEDNIHETGKEDLELPLFDLDTVAAATNNFSFANKIGEGGFGSVYKGVLSTGQEIAVKRLSETSRQGLNEFKNEVILIAKLQHRNLVRLLGGCIQGEERMLIYEYMPNGSLDTFIFGQTSVSLNWQKRFDIIVGIARGLLYLHRDSRLRIIHRDLKASNVLLDTEMLPKISDFGMARTFGADQMEENTKRVVGTYGYMAPEYAIDGIFSVKSDVFSFGVLVLEIVSGKKNRRFLHADHNLNLLGHAWKLWNEGKALELMDPLIQDSFPVSEVLRCIQVGFLCVQQRPEDRPTMPSVLLMLDSESAILPQPKQTSYYTERNFMEKEISSSGPESFTANELTISMLNAR